MCWMFRCKIKRERIDTNIGFALKLIVNNLCIGFIFTRKQRKGNKEQSLTDQMNFHNKSV